MQARRFYARVHRWITLNADTVINCFVNKYNSSVYNWKKIKINDRTTMIMMIRVFNDTNRYFVEGRWVQKYQKKNRILQFPFPCITVFFKLLHSLAPYCYAPSQQLRAADEPGTRDVGETNVTFVPRANYTYAYLSPCTRCV